MDLNAATNGSSQENNQLLDAIKIKFDSKITTEAKSSSMPTFNIPLLKIPKINAPGSINTVSETNKSNEPVTQLNQFLLEQLFEKQKNKDQSNSPTGVAFPLLQSSNNNVAPKYELPILNTSSSVTDIKSLNTAINKLHVKDNACEEDVVHISHTEPVAIDLSTALAVNSHIHRGTPPTREFIKTQSNCNTDFEIPFIECDRLDIIKKTKFCFPTSNQYCVTDISKLILRHSLAEPSPVGRFLCIEDDKYLAPQPLNCLLPKRCQELVKHKIEPFRFESKSPDDLILLALDKYQRRRYN